MIKRAALGPHKLSLPQIALIVAVGLLVIVVGGVMLRTYFSSAGTATTFERAGYTTTNLSNIQREVLLLRIETHALFSDFTRGFEPIESPGRDFKPVELRRDFLTAQLRVATAQASDNADALAEFDQVASTLAEYDSLLASVRANPTFDRSTTIAQSDKVLIQLERQVKALYDQQEVRFFQATGASLRAIRFSHTLLLVVGAMMLALSLVLAASLRQSVRTAFKRAYDALETEVEDRRRIEEAGRRLVEEKVVVDEVARIITSTLDIDEVYERFAAEVKKLVEFDRMSINICDKLSGQATMKHTIGQEVSGHRTGDTWSLDGTPSQVVIATGQTLLRSDISGRHFSTDQTYLDVDLRSMILLPLIYQGTAIGCMALRSTNIGAYGLREQAILERLAHQIAPAVANSELFEQNKRAEEAMGQSEARSKALLESASQGVVVANSDGEIVQINASALEMFGYGLDELLGQPVEMLVPDSVRDIHAVQRNSYFANPVSRPMGLGLELAGRRKDGTCFPMEISLSSIVTDGDTLALAFVADISERKQAEEAQRRWAEENSVMAEIGRTVSSSLDIDEVYNRLGHEIRKLIPFDRTTISMFDQEGESVSQTWVLGTEVPGRRPGDVIPLAGTFAEKVMRGRSPVMLEADNEPDLRQRFPGLLPNFRAGMRSFLAAPLIYRDEVIGVLQLRSKERGVYSQRHLDLAERVGNQIAGSVANSQLFAERKEAEAALRESEERFRQMAENMREAFFLVDHKNYRVLYVNRAFEELWCRSRESLYEDPSIWLEAIHPEDLELVNEALEKQLTTGEFDEEFRIILPDGSTRWIHDSAVPIKDELGQISRLVGIAEDVTERKQAEERIKASLEEKEILLKEINHRVKNNLQIVSSLLDLQSRDIQDGQVQEMLKESQARIRAMALIHEKLYQSEDLARIDFGEYLQSLTSELRRSHGLNTQHIELKLDAGHTFLGVDTAIPCGLIVNEMVSNSYKHAFPSGSGGEISIALRLEDQVYSLVVRDNGVGFPEDFDIRRSNTLGLKLVNALVDQLGGTIELHRNGGAEINITFPVL